MSTREKESLLKSDYKSKLNRMGVSLDRTDHPLNYYKQLFYEKSNAKSKVTRNNTPFYKEQIMAKKRQRSSSKKTKGKKNLDFEDISEEKSDEESNEINNTKGIKTTRLIESKKKKMPNKKEEIKSEKKIKNKKNEILISEKKENKSNTYNLRNKSGPKGNEKNILLFGAQSDINNNNNYYNNKNKNNKKNSSSKKSPQKDIYLKVNENKEEPKEKPILIEKKKRLLKRYPDVNEEETGPKLDQYHQVEDNNIITYDNNEINTQEENPIISETSSNYSNATSRFSRFSNYTLMSFSRLGNNIVNAKNCIMNKFKRNAYLFPLIILILFGIVFFLNERYQSYDRNNIIIIFSIIMGLIILFNLILYCKKLHSYKKIAKADKKELMKLFEDLNINKEDMGDNTILLNKFIEERIKQSGISEETYFKYVFPYLIKYLKKDGFYLEKVKNEENNNNNYWKEL